LPKTQPVKSPEETKARREASIKKTKPALEPMSDIKPPRNPSSLMKNAGKFQPNAPVNSV
jgi:hypothetical protein